MDYIAKLKAYSKKSICRVDLATLFSATSDEKLHGIITPLVQSGVLTPSKNAKTNGNHTYLIYDKYRIHVPEEGYEVEQQEIMSLHPAILQNGYLKKNPTEYIQYKEKILKLNHYLFSWKTQQGEMSKKERSFDIFGEEKDLENGPFRAFLSKLGLRLPELNCYDTPEYCFNDFIPSKKTHMTLLICENKDIWFNIRRLMFENQKDTLFGVHIDGVVFGCGNKASAKSALTAYAAFIGAEVNFLYWGDIDRAGFNIYLGAVQNNVKLNIQLFTAGYQAMLNRARERVANGGCIPDSDDEREIMGNYEPIYGLFSPSDQEQLREYIRINKRLPQEIINYAVLNDAMR